MMPQNQRSEVPVLAGLLNVDVKLTSPLRDFEEGGVAIQDTSQGVLGYEWVCYVDDSEVYVKRNDASAVLVFVQPEIQEISFTFDQNMRPAFAYQLANGNVYLLWYDSLTSNYRTDNFGVGRNPRLSMDDKRTAMSSLSDIIFGYIRDDSLYYRQQRDRFGTERLLRDGIPRITKLKNIGMTRNLRLLFELV